LQIAFRTNRLRRCALERDAAVRFWGPEVGDPFLAAINAIATAPSFESLYAVRSLRLHPLHGDRRGHYAMDLGFRIRLIPTLQEGTMVIVAEVSTHYGD